MADPVMSNLQLRRVLECVLREYEPKKSIFKRYSERYPLEAWIKFSDALRRSVFKEKKEDDFDEFLEQLVRTGYVQAHVASVHPVNIHQRLPKPIAFYRLSDKGITALASVKRKT